MTAEEEFLVSTWTIPADDASLRSGLWSLRLGETETVEQVEPQADSIYWATVEPGTRSLLLLNNDEARSAMMRLDVGEGSVLSSRWSSGGEGGSYLAFHPSGRFFVVANSSAGWSLFRSGSEPELIQTITNVGSGPHPRQAHSHPHCGIFSADGRWLYAADMGTDEVLAVPFDADAGVLGEPIRAHRAAPGSGPRHIVVGLEVLYVLNELGNTLEVLEPSGDGSMRSRQVFSTLPADFEGESHAGHLGLSPDGHHLYLTNRQHDSIAMFDVAADGGLEVRGWVPSGGAWPWHFAFARDGRMIVANNHSDTLAIFDVDDDGALAQSGEIALARPVFVIAQP